MSLWNLERAHGVVELAFDNPPRNFLTFAALEELGARLSELAADPDAAVIVLRSADPERFIAHADLDELRRLADGPVPEARAWYTTMRLIETMPQPVIAAIDGQAWGGGLELSLACTLRWASPRAHFSAIETALGIIPGAGGSQRLLRLIGRGPATDLVVTGLRVDAARALQLGIVSRVFVDDFDAELRAAAVELARMPRAAIAAAKRVMREGPSSARVRRCGWRARPSASCSPPPTPSGCRRRRGNGTPQPTPGPPWTSQPWGRRHERRRTHHRCESWHRPGGGRAAGRGRLRRRGGLLRAGRCRKRGRCGCRAARRTCAGVPGRCALPESCTQFVTEARAALGPVRAVVSNATGFGADSPGLGTALTVPLAEYQEMFTARLGALLALVHAAGADLDLGGRVVAVTSTGTQRHVPGYAPIAASMAAVESVVRYLAAELGPRGITANTAVGGVIDTEALAEISADPERLKEAVRRATPLGRVGRAADIGAVVSFLCSSAAGWVTGQSLIADGGNSLR